MPSVQAFKGVASLLFNPFVPLIHSVRPYAPFLSFPRCLSVWSNALRNEESDSNARKTPPPCIPNEIPPSNGDRAQFSWFSWPVCVASPVLVAALDPARQSAL